MKIRSGFVSNSSSSSFVVDGATTAQVARMMLYSIKFDRMQWGDDDEYYPEKLDNAIEWLSDNIGFNENIAFPWSVNEETFIFYADDRVVISTCNNNDWSTIGGEYLMEDYMYSDEYYNSLTSGLFLNLNTMQKATRKDIRGY